MILIFYLCQDQNSLIKINKQLHLTKYKYQNQEQINNKEHLIKYKYQNQEQINNFL